MSQIVVFLFVLFSLQAEAQRNAWPVDRYIKRIPESEAHTFSGFALEPVLKESSIKVLVWNIKKAEMKSWRTEFTKYGADRDLFLIQEAYQNELFNSTLSQYSDVRWDMGISFLYRQYNTATGNMIGSKVGPSYVKIRHTQDMEPGVSTPKTTTFAKYPIERSMEELLVISVHGINLTNYDSFIRHLAQAKEEIEKHKGPVLFAGDFNTRTGARTRHLEEVIASLGLTPVKFKNGHCRMRFKLTPYYLDHSFVRDLEVKNSEVDCLSKGSDHKPMLLELSLR